ncbi:MAG: ABC1 kinase family protein [Candidatus Ratteibacteria bacterium]
MRRYPVIRKLRRYRNVINILIKYGFGIIIERIHILKFPIRKRKKVEYSFPVRIRKILEELGPTFIKLGQILSTRPDLIPIEYIKELEKLQDEVKGEDFEIMKDFIESELGRKIEDIFEEFNSQPIASASISCVYKAKYKGNYVAVKVQRPNIKEQIYTDIQILYDIAELIEKFIKESEIYQPRKIVREFERSIKKELNFLIEGKNMEIIREKMKEQDGLFIPKVYKELSTEKILVTEYIEGIKINKVEEWSKFVDKEKIIRTGVNVILKQIFEIGFFHGDPHPGNIFVLKDGRIALVDFGIVGHLDEEKKYYLINLISGVIKGSPEKIILTLKYMDAIGKMTDIDQLKEDIEDLVETYKNISIRNIKIGELIGYIFDIMRKNRVKIPVSFSLMGKSIITLEGLCYFLQPEFKLASAIEPFYIEYIEKKLQISFFFKRIRDSIDIFQYLIKEIPERMENFLEKIKKQNIRDEILEKRIKSLNINIKKTGTKISLSLLISSLLISSVFLLISNYFYFAIFSLLLVLICIFIYLIKG